MSDDVRWHEIRISEKEFRYIPSDITVYRDITVYVNDQLRVRIEDNNGESVVLGDIRTLAKIIPPLLALLEERYGKKETW